MKRRDMASKNHSIYIMKEAGNPAACSLEGLEGSDMSKETRNGKWIANAGSARLSRVESVDREIGERIRARRILLGMSQTELASAVHLSYQQIQKYETGKNRVPASKILPIAQALRLPARNLLTEEESGDGMSSEAIDRSSLTAESQQVIKAYWKMPLRARRDVLRLMQSINPGN